MPGGALRTRTTPEHPWGQTGFGIQVAFLSGGERWRGYRLHVPTPHMW